MCELGPLDWREHSFTSEKVCVVRFKVRKDGSALTIGGKWDRGILYLKGPQSSCSMVQMGRLSYFQGLVLGCQEPRDWNPGVLTPGMGKGPVTSGLLSSLLCWYPQDTPDSITPLHLECTSPGLSTQCLHSIRMT